MLHLRTTVLSAHYDGELSAAAAARVDGHLRDCERCVAEYDELSSAANTVRHLGMMRAPQTLASKIREQIDAEERGMVPVLRSEIMRAKQPSGFFLGARTRHASYRASHRARRPFRSGIRRGGCA